MVNKQNQDRVVVVHKHIVLEPHRRFMMGVSETSHKPVQQHHVFEVAAFFESQFLSTHRTGVVFQKPRFDTRSMKRVSAFEKHVVARSRLDLSNGEPGFIQTNTTIHDC